MLEKLKVYFLIFLGNYQKALEKVEKNNSKELSSNTLESFLIQCYLLAATQKIEDLRAFIHSIKREHSLIFPEWQLIEAYLYLLENDNQEAIAIYSDLSKNKTYQKKIKKITKKITQFHSSEQILLNTSFKDFIEVKKIKSSKYLLILILCVALCLGYFSFIIIFKEISKLSYQKKDYFFEKKVFYSQVENQTNTNFSKSRVYAKRFLRKSNLLPIKQQQKKMTKTIFASQLNTFKKKIIAKKINESIFFYNQIQKIYSLSLKDQQKLRLLYETIVLPDFRNFKNNFSINEIELEEIPNYYGCYFQLSGVVSKPVVKNNFTVFNLVLVDKNNNVEKTVEVYVEKEINLDLKKINLLTQFKGFSTNKKKMIFKAIIIYN